MIFRERPKQNKKILRPYSLVYDPTGLLVFLQDSAGGGILLCVSCVGDYLNRLRIWGGRKTRKKSLRNVLIETAESFQE